MGFRFTAVRSETLGVSAASLRHEARPCLLHSSPAWEIHSFLGTLLGELVLGCALNASFSPCCCKPREDGHGSGGWRQERTSKTHPKVSRRLAFQRCPVTRARNCARQMGSFLRAVGGGRTLSTAQSQAQAGVTRQEGERWLLAAETQSGFFVGMNFSFRFQLHRNQSANSFSGSGLNGHLG